MYKVYNRNCRNVNSLNVRIRRIEMDLKVRRLSELAKKRLSAELAMLRGQLR